MSDLRVTDVQAALRHFANNTGHNVLTDDPHNILIDDKKYGMAVGHRLSIHNYEKSTRMASRGDIQLSSFIQQAESHIISEVNSAHSFARPDEKEFPWVRSTAPLGPYHGLGSTGGPYEHYATFGVQHPDGLMKGMIHQINKPDGWTTKKPSSVWEPHEDIHEALKSHTDLRPKYSPEKLKGFDHPLALERLISEKEERPGVAEGSNTTYKGLVHVVHGDHGDTNHYIYNPATEEMHRYG